MDFESIKLWLQRQTDKRIRFRWLTAALGIVLAPLGIAAGSSLVFVFARAATRNSEGPATTVTCFWVALGSIPVLFLINLLFPRQREPEKFYHEDQDISLANRYVNRYKAEMRILLWILFTGPRLADWVIASFREIRRLKTQDTHSCAAVLWLLMLKAKRVTYPDIQQEFDWLDVDATLPQLAWITGVYYFPTAPPAVSLTDDLRAAIRTGASPP